MVRALALLALLAALAACDPRPQEAPAPAPRTEAKPAPAPLPKQQAADLAAKCGKAAREQFQRALKDGIEADGIEATAGGKATAEYASHYNARLKTCFYLLTVTSPATLRKMLFDVNGGELYGEYLGSTAVESPVGRPKSCRVESFYCASGGEWDVLARPYMGD
jgi:hypothetical protein